MIVDIEDVYIALSTSSVLSTCRDYACARITHLPTSTMPVSRPLLFTISDMAAHQCFYESPPPSGLDSKDLIE